MNTLFLFLGLMIGAMIGIFIGFQSAKNLTDEVIAKSVSMTLLSLVMNPPKKPTSKKSEDKKTDGK